MKWGTKYPSDDVNRLYRAIERVQGNSDFTLFCLTDRADGILDQVIVLPIPDLPVLGNEVQNRGWRKITLFSPEVTQIKGPTVFLDLDVILVDKLDAFFQHDDRFKVIKDYKPIRYRNAWTGNTSTFFYHAGENYGVYEKLLETGSAITEKYRNEQEFLSDCMRSLGILKYWPKNWCVSFKYHCVPKFPASLWKAPELPDGAKVLVFHGRPKPDEALVGVGAKWYRPMKPAPWLAPFLQE